jgi:hypothetical protein
MENASEGSYEKRDKQRNGMKFAVGNESDLYERVNTAVQ